MKKSLVRQMQDYVAETCIGASAMRNQGGKGLVKTCRDFFKKLDLSRIPRRQTQFEKWLDFKTYQLRAKFPRRAQKFGTARKALNLFLRSAAYNFLLDRKYSLESLLPMLEVPLDHDVAYNLRTRDQSLPRKWPGLKWITDAQHGEYQRSAGQLANEWRLCRVHLDVFFYRNNEFAL